MWAMLGIGSRFKCLRSCLMTRGPGYLRLVTRKWTRLTTASAYTLKLVDRRKMRRSSLATTVRKIVWLIRVSWSGYLCIEIAFGRLSVFENSLVWMSPLWSKMIVKSKNSTLGPWLVSRNSSPALWYSGIKVSAKYSKLTPLVYRSSAPCLMYIVFKCGCLLAALRKIWLQKTLLKIGEVE